MLPLVTNQISGITAPAKVQKVGSDFFKAASNFIPPVAESSAAKENKNNTTNQQRLVASSTTFLAQLIGQNDNAGTENYLSDFSLVKYMPSFAAYPSNNNEQLELFAEEQPEAFAVSAQASASYSQAEAIDRPQPASKLASII